MLILAEGRHAEQQQAAGSAEGGTVCVLIRCLDSSCRKYPVELAFATATRISPLARSKRRAPTKKGSDRAKKAGRRGPKSVRFRSDESAPKAARARCARPY